MFARLLAIVGLLSFVGLVYVLQATTPSEAGAVGVLAVFLLLYVTLVAALAFFLFYTYQLVVRLFFGEMKHRLGTQFGLKHSYYYASILALGPVMLISLRSVGKGGLLEFGLVALLLVVGCVYVSRQTS
jgi:hypothetical protein